MEQGRISNCRIYGDFFAKGNVQEVEEKLKGVRMVKEDLVEVLSTIDLVTTSAQSLLKNLRDSF